MDLQEQRITCLRMAVDMGCKPDAVIATATELMSFVTDGAASPPTTVAEPQAPVADAIAACGTALPASETAGLVLAQPTDEAPAEAPAVAAQAVEPEAVATEPGPGPAEAAPVEASPEPAPVATAPVEAASPASEPVAAGFQKRLRRHRCRQPNRVQRLPKMRLHLFSEWRPSGRGVRDVSPIVADAEFRWAPKRTQTP